MAKGIRGLALLIYYKIMRRSPKTGDPNLDHSLEQTHHINANAESE